MAEKKKTARLKYDGSFAEGDSYYCTACKKRYVFATLDERMSMTHCKGCKAEIEGVLLPDWSGTVYGPEAFEHWYRQYENGYAFA